MNTLTTLVKRHPLPAFLILAFGLSWSAVIFYQLRLFPAPIFTFGPSLAAVIVAGMTGGRAGLKALFSRLFRWRVGLRWYLVALFAPLPLFVAIVYVNVLLGAPAPTAGQLAAWPSLFGFFLGLILSPFGGAWEELGWRGYALPELLSSRSSLAASLILGVLWAAWHLPILITGQIPWPNLVFIMGISIIFTWLFNNTRGSVLLAFLLHASIDAYGEFFIPMFSGADLVRVYWLMGAGFGLWAIGLIIRTAANAARKDDAALQKPARA